ncbi:MAG: LysM peptidoglycan-binding domain-containing protein [Anaerolineae bacterium]
MRRKPLALLLIVLMIVSAFLAGCRKSAVPPVEELTPEEEATAMQEAQENTEEMQTTPAETEEAPTSPEDSETSTPEVVQTEEPTPEPTATTEVAEPTTAPTAEPTEVSTAPETTTGPTTYVVKPGDNLFRISLRFNTTVQAVAQANNITNPSMIYVGQTLTIPAGGGGDTTPPPSNQQCSAIYTVKPGDNLFRIALRYGYSQYHLAQVNGISNPSLVQVGQELCIP